MRNSNESPCHIESTWYLWNLFEGWGFALILMSIPLRLMILWTVLQLQGRSYWYLIRLAPHEGCFCLSLRILFSSFLGMEPSFGCLGPGLSGTSVWIPPSLYLLTRWVSVLRDIPNTIQICLASSTPSMD